LEELYAKYHDQANFLLVIVHEAGHGIEGLEFLLDDQDPVTRRLNIARAMDLKHVTIPAVFDTPDSVMERTFSVCPFRVVGVNHGEIGLDLPASQVKANFREVPNWLDVAIRHHDVPMM
jgi:hypothetical protein